MRPANIRKFFQRMMRRWKNAFMKFYSFV